MSQARTGTHPVLIQGGMGAGVSDWRLARAVSKAGHLGVVSGTALDAVLARRLQLGDLGGHLRRAMAHFPRRRIADQVLQRYLIPGGKRRDAPFLAVPVHSVSSPRRLVELTVLANFVEVYLAKEGHDGVVGINYLEKIQLPNVASLYGAMLAGVDYVLMGAGIPREIPGVLDKLARHEVATLKLAVAESRTGVEHQVRFDPTMVVRPPAERLQRPFFLPIVASATLAVALAKRPTGRVDGFIVEGPVAGGHNAPPRGPLRLDERGQPVYSERDRVDLARIRQLGVPFWLAGSYGRPGRLAEAVETGANGIQVGTLFAFCRESGIAPQLKDKVLQRIRRGECPEVFTDPTASPTGFPFKTVRLDETLADPDTYSRRERRCDLGYLRTLYEQPDGKVGYRCPAEPPADYARKGGRRTETRGRRCLCNGLVAAIGMGQIRSDGFEEPPIVTSGDDLSVISALLADGAGSYSAGDVIQLLCGNLSGS